MPAWADLPRLLILLGVPTRQSCMRKQNYSAAAQQSNSVGKCCTSDGPVIAHMPSLPMERCAVCLVRIAVFCALYEAVTDTYLITYVLAYWHYVRIAGTVVAVVYPFVPLLVLLSRFRGQTITGGHSK